MKKSEVIELYGGTVRDWRKHKTGGGWVHKDANVSESAYVGPMAIVRDGIIRGGTIEGGTIYGGTIRDGIIRGGTIEGGTIEGGTIRGGTIRGGTHHNTPAQASRSDGYIFTAYYDNDVLMVTAGCRDFTWDQAVAHWGNTEHHKHAESMRIIKYLRSEVEAR